MKKFLSLLRHSATQRLIFYSGFVALVLTWPAANIVLKNDSFRFVGNWSFWAFFVFLLAYAVFPVFFAAVVDCFLERKSKNYSLLFRKIILVAGSAVFWAQLTEYHLLATAKKQV